MTSSSSRSCRRPRPSCSAASPTKASPPPGPADSVANLKDEVDGVILVAGSATLVKSLIESDLVDELRLMVFPVLLGQGKRLFPEGEAKHSLKLIESKTVGDGIALLRYERG